MLIMLDDIQLRDPDVLFPFLSSSICNDVDTITDIDSLHDVVSEIDVNIEIMINDLEDVPEEQSAFAKKVVKTLMDCRLVNKKVQVTFFDEDEAAKSPIS